MEKKKVLLFTYSKANFGDDLFVYILANRYKNIEFYIQIQEPKYKKAFENLHNVIILNEAREVDKINVNEFDAFVYVGGSIFIESEYGKHEAKEFNKFIKKVKENGKPFFYMTCNFGPYKTNEYLQQIKENLKLCQGICFRDFESYDKFKDISSVSYAPDIAFSYDYRDIIEKKEKKSIGISVINLLIRENLKQKTDIYNDYIKRIIIKFSKRNYKVSLISFCEFEQDEKAIDTILSMVPKKYLNNVEILQYKGNIEEFIKKYSKINYMVCTRYHSMILSTILRQKVYNLFYSKKTKNTIDDYRIFKKADNIEDINFETRLKKSDFKKARLKKINEIKEKSNSQFTEFEQWLYNNI
jgi:colanic acid/amylovoran biosynthesis protein